MRQAGIIAAAGIVALTGMVDRLAEDHANARALAVGLAGIPGLRIDPDAIATNIVYFRVTAKGLDAPAVVARLGESGVRVLPTAKDQMRAVLNYHVTGADVQRALAVFSRVMKG
jgi:threonine aldolase